MSATQSRILYNPDGVQHDLDSSDAALCLTNFERFSGSTGATQISHGGQAVSVVHDHWRTYSVEWDALVYPDGAGTLNNRFYARLTAFISFATGGGEFSYEARRTQKYSSLLNGAVTFGTTALTVDSISGLTIGDTVYLEDADNPLIWEEQRVVTPLAGTTVNISPGTVWPYVDNSIIRDREYFPKCILVDRNIDFSELPGGQGANRYRLAFRFRTVR